MPDGCCAINWVSNMAWLIRFPGVLPESLSIHHLHHRYKYGLVETVFTLERLYAQFMLAVLFDCLGGYKLQRPGRHAANARVQIITCRASGFATASERAVFRVAFRLADYTAYSPIYPYLGHRG